MAYDIARDLFWLTLGGCSVLVLCALGTVVAWTGIQKLRLALRSRRRRRNRRETARIYAQLQALRESGAALRVSLEDLRRVVLGERGESLCHLARAGGEHLRFQSCGLTAFLPLDHALPNLVLRWHHNKPPSRTDREILRLVEREYPYQIDKLQANVLAEHVTNPLTRSLDETALPGHWVWRGQSRIQP